MIQTRANTHTHHCSLLHTVPRRFSGVHTTVLFRFSPNTAPGRKMVDQNWHFNPMIDSPNSDCSFTRFAWVTPYLFIIFHSQMLIFLPNHNFSTVKPYFFLVKTGCLMVKPSFSIVKSNLFWDFSIFSPFSPGTNHGERSLVTSTPAKILAVSEMPGRRSASVSGGRWSKCR